MRAMVVAKLCCGTWHVAEKYTGFVACTLAYGREKWVESLEPCREILEPGLFLIVIS
jgi:hypothetical protein